MSQNYKENDNCTQCPLRENVEKDQSKTIQVQEKELGELKNQLKKDKKDMEKKEKEFESNLK